jgi:Flp pilus assembly protein TadG
MSIMNRKDRHHQGPGRERGGFVVTFILAVPILLGAVGVVYSVTDSIIARTHLQAAADACALAGAARAAQLGATEADVLSTARSVAQTMPIGLTRTALSADTSAAARVSPQTNLAGATTDVFEVSCEVRYLGYLATFLRNTAGNALSTDMTVTAKAAYSKRDTCKMPMAICKAPRTSVSTSTPTAPGAPIVLENGEANSTTSGWLWSRIPGEPNPRSYLGKSKDAGSCGDNGFIGAAGTLEAMPGQVMTNEADRNLWTQQVNNEPYEIVPIVTCASDNSGSMDISTVVERVCIQFLPWTSTTSGGTKGQGKGSGTGTTTYTFPLKYLGPAGTTSQCGMVNSEKSGSVTVADVKKGGFTPLYPPRLLQ